MKKLFYILVLLSIVFSSCSKPIRGAICKGRYYDPSNSFNIKCDDLAPSAIIEFDHPNQKGVLFRGCYGDFLTVEVVKPSIDVGPELRENKKLQLELYFSEIILKQLKDFHPSTCVQKSIHGFSEIFGPYYFVVIYWPGSCGDLISDALPLGILFSFDQDSIVVVSGKPLCVFACPNEGFQEILIQKIQDKLIEKRIDLNLNDRLVF